MAAAIAEIILRRFITVSMPVFTSPRVQGRSVPACNRRVAGQHLRNGHPRRVGDPTWLNGFAMIYSADREVIEACRARGAEVAARQLERWRPLLPHRQAEHVPGLRGSRTVRAPGYVEQVIVIAEAVGAGFPLRQVPLVLFARGFDVELDAVSIFLPRLPAWTAYPTGPSQLRTR
jgi:hypothetical protein